MGKSGAAPGVSFQSKEGQQQFKDACREILPLDARVTTNWLYSDCPTTVEGCHDTFPKLKGVAKSLVEFDLFVSTLIQPDNGMIKDIDPPESVPVNFMIRIFHAHCCKTMRWLLVMLMFYH